MISNIYDDLLVTCFVFRLVYPEKVIVTYKVHRTQIFIAKHDIYPMDTSWTDLELFMIYFGMSFKSRISPKRASGWIGLTVKVLQTCLLVHNRKDVLFIDVTFCKGKSDEYRGKVRRWSLYADMRWLNKYGNSCNFSGLIWYGVIWRDREILEACM